MFAFNKSLAKLKINWFTIAKVLVVSLVAAIAFILRIYPGYDHFIWTYDQARDRYVIASIIAQRHLVLHGPQTETFGLSHGPIFYYLMAPFYYLSKGDPNLPGLAMALINISTVIPILLLTQKLFKNRITTILAGLLFLFSYQQLEYSRWISNVAVSIPFLAWSYYFLFMSVWQKQSQPLTYFFLGLCLGLATQAEFFLISIIVFVTIILALKKINWRLWFGYSVGTVLGLLPFILVEIMSHFLGTKVFFEQFLQEHAQVEFSASAAFSSYLNHLGMTMKQVIGGISNPMGLFLLIGLVALSIYFALKSKNSSEKEAVLFLFLPFLFHAFLFTFHFVDSVFLDLGLGSVLIILTAYTLNKLRQINLPIFFGCVTLIAISIIVQFNSYIIQEKPFGEPGFIQDGILYKNKMAIVHRIYQLTQGKPFSFQSIGTPYGVRTVWASIFEQYVQRTHAILPEWFGYYANGYPGETLFKTQDFPNQFHVVIIESNIKALLPAPIYQAALQKIDETTTLISQEKMFDFTIQLRQPITTAQLKTTTTTSTKN